MNEYDLKVELDLRTDRDQWKELARLSEQDNDRLRADGLRFAQWIDGLYSSLPRDRPPGPPITLLQEMRRAFGADAKEAPRTCATCHAVLAPGPQPAATYEPVTTAYEDVFIPDPVSDSQKPPEKEPYTGRPCDCGRHTICTRSADCRHSQWHTQ